MSALAKLAQDAAKLGLGATFDPFADQRAGEQAEFERLYATALASGVVQTREEFRKLARTARRHMVGLSDLLDAMARTPGREPLLGLEHHEGVSHGGGPHYHERLPNGHLGAARWFR